MSRGPERNRESRPLRATAQDKEMTKDARELAALKHQRKEEQVAQEGLQSVVAGDEG